MNKPATLHVLHNGDGFDQDFTTIGAALDFARGLEQDGHTLGLIFNDDEIAWDVTLAELIASVCGVAQ